MLAVYYCSDMGFFRHLSNHPFLHSIISEVHQQWGSPFFLKCSKFHVDLRYPEKKSEIFFNFRDNWIWVSCVKNSILPRENICHRELCSQLTVSRFQLLLRKNLSNWSSFTVIKKCDTTTAVQISAVFSRL